MHTFAELGGCVKAIADSAAADVAAHSVLALLIASTRIRVVGALVDICNNSNIRLESKFLLNLSFHELPIQRRLSSLKT